VTTQVSSRVFVQQRQAGNLRRHGTLRVGAAWRTYDSDWAFLNRLDLVLDELRDSLGRTRSRSLVENFNANWQPTSATQLSLQLGLKYVLDQIDVFELDALTGLVGIELRRAFWRRWDLGVHGSVLESFGPGTRRQALGASVGYAPADNVWLSVGYNVSGFVDADFAGAAWRAQGPYVRFRIMLDPIGLRELMGSVALLTSAH
jgi:hypothetical protein